MRIAFLAYGGLEQTTGGYIYDRHLVEGLRALGTEVDTFALRPEDRDWPAEVAGFDLVLEDELIHPSLYRRGPRAPGAPRPKVVSLVHNLYCLQPATLQREMAEHRERAYLASLDAVVAVCADTLEGVRTVSPGRASLPAVVARAGADHLGAPLEEALVRTRAHQAGPLRVLFVGTVAPHKGVHRLLGVLAGLPRDSCQLEVVGSLAADPEYVRLLRAEIERLDLGSQVQLLGERGSAEVVAHYRHSQVLVLPSDREAIPLCGLEGLAFGLPLLMTSVGGPREILGSSAAGCLLAPDDQRGWTENLRLFASDRTWLEGTAVAALARHRELPRWADTAQVVNGFLKGLS